VDENGNYSHIAYYEHDNTFYKKLSEKSRENIEKHIKKTREKATEKQKGFQEKLEEKRTGQEDGTATPNKAEQLLEEKMSESKDGTIYLYDTAIRTIIEAAQEENAGKTTVKDQPQVGANLDLKI
jgi:TRAP-type C4-dicarboxylate transport system substrate-binding protein